MAKDNLESVLANTNKKFGKCLKINITKVAGTENYTYKVDESTVDNDSGC